MKEHFVSSFQKVGTFTRAGWQKQGGNVVSYFTTPKGKVLHVIAGPVDAQTFLSETRWAVEMWKLAELEKQIPPEMFFRKAHLDRLAQITKEALTVPRGPGDLAFAIVAQEYSKRILNARLNSRPAKVHQLLAAYPLPRIEAIYRVVFERILNQKLSTVPVKNG
jgi:hypothetical protein